MDLLKGITEELKGSSEQDRASDRHQSRPNPGRTAETREPASTSTTSETEGDAQVSERTRDDEHVCAFCGTDFAASRGACPDCSAEIIVRGER